MLRIFVFTIFVLLLACQSMDQAQMNDPIRTKAPELKYLESRMWPDQTLSKDAYLAAVKIAKEQFATERSPGTWQSQGPGNYSGRVSTIEIDSEGNIYLGYSKSGIYKSVDDGISYTPLIDDQPLLSVSDIEVDPTDDNIIYVGTGDVDISLMYGIGNGILKSTDGGSTWENIGLQEGSIVSRVHVDPTNPNLVFASTMGLPSEKSIHRGVYKSENAGESWEQILHVNDSTGIQDMLVDPTNPDIIYASGWNRLRSNTFSTVSGPDARIYRTRDGGETWKILEDDLPEGDFARVGLAMSGSDPNVIFANFGTTQNFESMHKSFDGGDSWEMIAERGVNGLDENSHGGFAWFFGQMRVNPQDDNDIFLLGVRLYRTRDGGETWEEVTNGIHVDHHELIFDGDRIYVGNDGGAYRSEDLSNNWTDIDFESTGMLYKVGYNPHQPDLYYGGSQDNGTYGGNVDMFTEWFKIGGGDGFYPAFHPTEEDIYFTQSQNGWIVMQHPLGGVPLTSEMEGRFYWDTPYFLSPINPNLVIIASDRVYAVLVDVDEGTITTTPLGDVLTEPDSEWWSHSISTISQSPEDGNILYAGTTDGLVWRSLDFGNSWEEINAGIPRRFVSKIVASPSEANRVFVTLTGYRDGDYIPHIFRSDNLGETWVDISSSLPPFSVNDLIVYPNSQDQILFAATDGGVYFSEDAGANWDRLGENMPIIPAWDLEYYEATNQLVVGTYGKGIQNFDLTQVDIEPMSSNVNSISEKYIKLYPNVVTTSFQIRSPNVDEYYYSILDSNGKIHAKGTFNGDKLIDCQFLQAGVFYVKCWNHSSNQTFTCLKM